MSSVASRAVRNITGTRRRQRAEALAHLEAVEVGEHDVEHDEVGPEAATARSASRPFAAVSTSNPS